MTNNNLDTIDRSRELKAVLYDLVGYGKFEDILAFVKNHQLLVRDYDIPAPEYQGISDDRSILKLVVQRRREESRRVMELLVENGAAIDSADSNEFTALCWSVMRGKFYLAEYLLSKKANPNIGYPLRSCSAGDVEDPIAMAKLLLDHGADINAIDELSTGAKVTALDWVGIDTEVGKYLRSRGAKSVTEILGAEQPTEKVVKNFRTRTIQYFTNKFGAVSSMSLGNIVSDGSGIEIHWVAPGARRGFMGRNEDLVVFTTGLSQYAMPAPRAYSAFRYAELMITLPASWPTPDKAIQDPKMAWPIQWLRQMASYPILNQQWLGWPITIIPNEVPPKPLGPDCPFSAWMLIGNRDGEVIESKNGDSIQLYSCYPLYTEEYEIERDKGFIALSEEFDRLGLGPILDMNRPNAAK